MTMGVSGKEGPSRDAKFMLDLSYSLFKNSAGAPASYSITTLRETISCSERAMAFVWLEFARNVNPQERVGDALE